MLACASAQIPAFKIEMGNKMEEMGNKKTRKKQEKNETLQ